MMNKALKYHNIIETPESTVAAAFEPSNDASIVLLSESQLETRLVDQLAEQGYAPFHAANEDAMLENLRAKLERLNSVSLTDQEWRRLLKEELANPNKGILEKTALLQSDSTKIAFQRDDGSFKNLMLINKGDLHANALQVMRQYSSGNGAKRNRYDVTILVNGLPLVQIELKKTAVALREAFNQIQRYQNDSFGSGAGLFEFVQIFVISNGRETRYYSNTTRGATIEENGDARTGKKQKQSSSFKFASCWADAQNKRIRNLYDFAKTFFAKHTLLSILAKFCVFTEDKKLLVMRPYQIAATERILTKINLAVNNNLWSEKNSGGYVWHTTGSGKTLASFKTAKLAAAIKEVDKVLFVVDRKDLDYQTIREYDRFEKGAANGSRNTATLKRQLEDLGPNGEARQYKIIVTTIQKLQAFIRSAEKSSPVFQKRVVFIFDECHRSQFGDMHKAIDQTFKKKLLFGFTGTPIFAANAARVNGKLWTTEAAFGDAGHVDPATGKRLSSALHVYNIIDAINDDNVLKFHVDFVSTVKRKDGGDDYLVDKIDTAGAIQSPSRIKNVVSYLLGRFDQKTCRNDRAYSFKAVENVEELAQTPTAPIKLADRRYKGFNSIFAVDSIGSLILYYQEFKRQLGERFGREFKIATIFSYSGNPNQENPNEDRAGGERYYDGEDQTQALGVLDDENSDDTKGLDGEQRAFLDQAIQDYNAAFHTSYAAEGESFANYYKNVSQRVKNREVDLLLVVNMFLTGFDAPTLNTLWLDKNLRFHGLVQAFSRTNRILNSVKTQGNIVCFRNLRQELDDALALFGDKNASSFVLMKSYKDYAEGYKDERGVEHKGYFQLVDEFADRFAPYDDEPLGEDAAREFVVRFSAILRLQNILRSFDEFEGNDPFSLEEFQRALIVYLGLRDKFRDAQGSFGDKKRGEDINDDLVFETELVEQLDVTIDYILKLVWEYGKSRKDRALGEALDRAIDSSPTLRSKKELVNRFVARISPDAETLEFQELQQEWRVFVQKEREEAEKELVQEEKLDSKKTRKLLDAAFRNAQVGDDPAVAISDVGPELDAVLPARSFFSPSPDGADRLQLKDRVLAKLRRLFEKYCGLTGPEE